MAAQGQEGLSPADTQLMRDAWGALNFILAFYDPGQRYLDTNAWKQAEAGGRAAHAALRTRLDEIAALSKEPR